MRVAAVVPAYNEAERIGSVLKAISESSLVDEIVVVNDGSDDATAEVAAAFESVRVITLPFNRGKGGAVAEGVEATNAEIILLLDADLVGLQPRHIEALILPVLTGSDMTVGLFKKGKLWSDAAQALSPSISGQRAMRRHVMEAVDDLCACRMGMEVAITRAAKAGNCRVTRVDLDGVTHTSKEKKFGLVRGATERAKMYAEIGKTIVKPKKTLD